VAPEADNSDSLFDLYIITNGDGWRPLWKAVAMTRRGKQGGLPNVIQLKLSKLTIESDYPVSFLGDGEIKEGSTIFRVGIIKRGIRVIVPGKRKEEEEGEGEG
jgi:diacylglycerol kinase family enzyme